MARLCLLVLAALLTLAAPAAAAPRAAEPYGLLAVNANFVPGTTVAERADRYRRLADAGVRAVRLDLPWVAVDPPGEPKGAYDFAALDREVAAVRAAGLRIIGILGYGHPDFSSRGGTVQATPLSGGIPPFYVANAQYFPPDDPADFAAYATAVARRYASDAVGWEIWNEENEGWRFWPPHEDPPAYARLLCTARAALHAATPGVPVVVGGLFFPAVAGAPGMSAPDFLQAAFDAEPGLAGCFDAVAYHPYPYPFTAPELDVPVRGSVLAAYDAMRAVLRRNGAGGAPLWITEVGWPTHDRTYGVSEAKQAQYLARLLTASFAQGVPVVNWYTYGDYADPTGANQEAWFGFFRPDESAKPAYRALQTWTGAFAGLRFDRDLSRTVGLPAGEQNAGGRGFALRFRGRDRRVTAVWLASESAAEGQGPASDGGPGAARRVTVRIPARGRSVTVVDLLGARRSLPVRDGGVSVEAGPSPLYLVDSAR